MNKVILLIFILIISVAFPTKEYFTSDLYLAEPTKCFSCERQLPDGEKYKGGRTKCFSCEKDMANRYGSSYGSLGQPSKCFSCETALLNK